MTLTVAASNPTNPRIDVVYVAIQDSQYAGSTNGAIPNIATGTASASPNVPSIPSNAIALAQITVAANASSIVNGNITSLAPQVGPTAYSFLSAGQPNWSFPGICTVTPQVNGGFRVDVDLSILRINTTYAINTSKISLGVVLPPQAVGNSNLKYVMGGMNNNSSITQVGIKPSTGEVILSAPNGAFTWATNDSTTATVTYYI